MTGEPPVIKPGDLLVGRRNWHGSEPDEIVTVQRLTPSGRIVLVEYPDQQHNPITGSGKTYSVWSHGGGVRESKFSGPSGVRLLEPEESVEELRAKRQAWVDEQNALKDRHAQMTRIRDHISKLERRWPSAWAVSKDSTPLYPYSQNTLDMLEQQLAEMLEITPEVKR